MKYYLYVQHQMLYRSNNGIVEFWSGVRWAKSGNIQNPENLPTFVGLSEYDAKLYFPRAFQ